MKKLPISKALFGDAPEGFDSQTAMDYYRWYLEDPGTAQLTLDLVSEQIVSDAVAESGAEFAKAYRAVVTDRLALVRKALVRAAMSGEVPDSEINKAWQEYQEVSKAVKDRSYDRNRKGQFASQNTLVPKIRGFGSSMDANQRRQERQNRYGAAQYQSGWFTNQLVNNTTADDAVFNLMEDQTKRHAEKQGRGGSINNPNNPKKGKKKLEEWTGENKEQYEDVMDLIAETLGGDAADLSSGKLTRDVKLWVEVDSPEDEGQVGRLVEAEAGDDLEDVLGTLVDMEDFTHEGWSGIKGLYEVQGDVVDPSNPATQNSSTRQQVGQQLTGGAGPGGGPSGGGASGGTGGAPGSAPGGGGSSRSTQYPHGDPEQYKTNTQRNFERISVVADQWDTPGNRDTGKKIGGYLGAAAGGATGGGLAGVAAGGAVGEKIGENAISAARAVGDHGEDANKFFGPKIRRAAYRRRGEKKSPEKQLQSTVQGTAQRAGSLESFRRQLVQPIPNTIPLGNDPSSGSITELQPAPVMQLMRRKLPDLNRLELHLSSGAIPPSEGILIDDSGKIASQSVGYGDDHYLPFSPSQLSRVGKPGSGKRSGSLIRTRTVGGLTSEDIHTGLMSGMDSVSVVSHSGVFTVRFDQQTLGRGKNRAKANRMKNRYEKLTDSLSSGKVILQDIPDDRRAELKQQVANEIPGQTEELAKERRNRFEELKKIERENPTPSMEQRNAWGEEFFSEIGGGGFTDDDGNPMPMDRLLGQATIKAGREVTDPAEVAQLLGQGAEYKAFTERKEKEYRSMLRPLTLNGEGYQQAMMALKEQFPYFIRDVSWTPPTLSSGKRAKDKGYVKARHNRPDAALEGFWDSEVEGYRNPGKKREEGLKGTGKVRASRTGYQNQTAHDRLDSGGYYDLPKPESGGDAPLAGAPTQIGADAGSSGSAPGISPGRGPAIVGMSSHTPSGVAVQPTEMGPSYKGFANLRQKPPEARLTSFDKIRKVMALRQKLQGVSTVQYITPDGTNKQARIWGDKSLSNKFPILFSRTSDDEFLDRVSSDQAFADAATAEVGELYALGTGAMTNNVASSLVAELDNTHAFDGIVADKGVPKNPKTALSLLAGLSNGTTKDMDFSTPQRDGAGFMRGLTQADYLGISLTDPDTRKFIEDAPSRWGVQLGINSSAKALDTHARTISKQGLEALNRSMEWRANKRAANYDGGKVSYGGRTWDKTQVDQLQSAIGSDALALAKLVQLKRQYDGAGEVPGGTEVLTDPDGGRKTLRMGNSAQRQDEIRPAKGDRAMKLALLEDARQQGVGVPTSGWMKADAPVADTTGGSLDAMRQAGAQRGEEFEPQQVDPARATAAVDAGIDHRKLGMARENIAKLQGLAGPKGEFEQLVSDAVVDKQREAMGIEPPVRTKHLVFTGNPGTGKTTYAREIANAYNALGIIPKDTVKEVSRADLVGEYSGETAPKTRKAFEEARGGVLFVDEAYALKNGPQDSYGQEAVDELMRLAENHRDDTVVILAGYGSEMDGLMKANPGMRSRFPTAIDFPDYSAKDMVKIGQGMFSDGGLTLAPAAGRAMKLALSEVAAGEGHGNARDVRTLKEKIERAQNARLATVRDPSREDLTAITARDVRNGQRMFYAERNYKRRSA